MEIYLNHDRWIAECPKCAWAMQASPEQFRKMGVFVCGVLPSGVTLMTGCGHREGIKVPPPKTIDAIIAVMRERPDSSSRNWTPDETIEAIKRENRGRGLQKGGR